MKKILFVLGSLTGGGAEKAMVNLLHLIDYNRYEVSVQLFENRGINLEYLPSQVKLLPDFKSQQWLLADFKTYAVNALKGGHLDLLWKRVWGSLIPIWKNIRNGQYQRLCAWKAIRGAFPKSKEKYDIAVAYIQGMPIYYVVDCVQADKKIGWMHIDYSKIDNVPRDEVLAYYKELDEFVSMSSKCVDELKRAFPSIEEKIHLLHNLNSVEMIETLSKRENADDMLFEDGIPVILSIGRLCEQKGYDYAIQAAEIMAKKGIPFRWYVLGTGELKTELKKLVEEKGLQEQFIFLGIKSNPYPYIRKATIIAQTSRYEGKSVVLDEAKILKKPILVTNYNSVEDQITHGRNGYIVNINAEDIAKGLMEMLSNEELREQLVKDSSDVEQEQRYWLEKHYELFER